MPLTITVPEPLAKRLLSRAEAEKLPVEELASRLLEDGIQRRLPPAQWAIANQRRVALIEKRFATELTAQEEHELQHLQGLAVTRAVISGAAGPVQLDLRLATESKDRQPELHVIKES